MPLLSLRESLKRSKAKIKKLMSNVSEGTAATTIAITGGHDTPPSVASLSSYLKIGADILGPLRPAIEGLNKLINAYECPSHERNEYIELRKNIDGVLKDISAHTQGPMGHRMTTSARLICRDIQMEVERAERIQGRNTDRKFADAMKGQDGVIGCCRQVHAHLERLKLNLNMSILEAVNKHMLDDELAKMSPSMSAIYNSAESDTIKRGLCTPGTRQPQIDLLIEWARTPNSGKTCWMNGMAGTGKTTIAYTVCSQLEQNSHLGASFFCSRTIPECRQVKHIIPTIAYQLAQFSLPFRYELTKALERDPNAHKRALGLQYQKLIVDPLIEAKDSLPVDFIVVIDALDECENEDSVSQILDQLLSTTGTIPIRFLISSRPENQITFKMARRLNGRDDTRLVLHDLDRSTVKADIAVYMRAELNEVPLTDAQWPLVVDCCGELFIYASTICRYLKNAHEAMSLNEAMNTVTTPGSTHWHERTIDDLYRSLLDAVFGSPGVNDPDKKRMSDILQTVVCAMEPISVDTIANLLRLGSGDRVERLLAPLRSVTGGRRDPDYTEFRRHVSPMAFVGRTEFFCGSVLGQTSGSP